MSTAATKNTTTATAQESVLSRSRRAVAVVAAAALTATGALASQAGAAPAPPPASTPLLAPFYTELDLTGDDQVTDEDLSVLSAAIGTTSSDDGWADVAELDLTDDGSITAADLALLSQRMVYDDGPFELIEADVVSMQAAMNAGVTTSVDLTRAYLDRIAAYDRTVVEGASRPLAAIISTNADAALAAARRADEVRADRGMVSMLLGVPTTVKDNYNTTDMVTTGGCGCWDANQTSSDATMVEGLRADGAVLIAKASLDEFAFGFSSLFSSFLPAGETLPVANPYDTSRTAGGSSGGTGAAVAANLVGVGFGTDTGGSIRVPSSYNQLVGVRPTVGLASRAGIIPLALSQDTGGPMTRSVIDAAVALDAVVGIDPDDPVTERQRGNVPTSYTSSLDADALRGTRLGYVPSMLGTNPDTRRVWEETVQTLEAQGAEVVEVTPPAGLNAVLAEPSGSTNEFRHDLDAYVAEHLASGVMARTLSQIAESGRIVPSRASTYRTRAAVTEETYQAWAGPEGSHTVALAQSKVIVTQMLDDANLDALIYPSTNGASTIGFNMRLSPNTGMPSVTVPMGEASPGAGVNLELLGRDFAEGDLLGLAFAWEQVSQARTTPPLFGPLS